ncbi:hypothetical protein [Halorubrum cibi]|uniref:Uncharacterized protein n=1 Tax=Halorubrum cibi TaxID=413815 RepID=A0A521EKP5_9EURY|nr:hypothetical protein [Halorubrum cibi]SMO84462.1 hypothetical protein SAMN06264867_11164 [Halorubrum cibi]
MSPPSDDAAETRDRPSDDDAGDAPAGDASTRYWIVRKAVEDALMNVFWTIVSLALAVALLWFGVIAAIGAIDGSLVMIPVAVALLALAVVTLAVALEIPLPLVGD